MPEKYFEVRWHGRAGQGAKSASQFLAEAVMENGQHATSFPEYGAERTGAPMKAFNRIGDVPIRIKSGVETPDIILVIDDTLLGNKDITMGVKPNTVLVVNTTRTIEEVRKLTNFEGKIATVHATGIAEEEVKKNVPNTPMVGAIVRVTKEFLGKEIVPLSIVKNKVEKAFGKKFAQEIVDANLRCVDRGYQEVQF